MPGIKKFIENVMGVAPRDTVNPDEVQAPSDELPRPLRGSQNS